MQDKAGSGSNPKRDLFTNVELLSTLFCVDPLKTQRVWSWEQAAPDDDRSIHKLLGRLGQVGDSRFLGCCCRYVSEGAGAGAKPCASWMGRWLLVAPPGPPPPLCASGACSGAVSACPS